MHVPLPDGQGSVLTDPPWPYPVPVTETEGRSRSDSNLPEVRKRVRSCVDPLPFADTAHLYARPGEGS